jgi:hypothetical protein
MNKILYFALFLLFTLPIVYANLQVDSTAQQNPTYVGESKIFYITLVNNNTFPIYNISFSPIAKYTFSSPNSMLPGQSSTIPYSVLNGDVSSSIAVSTISYFFDTTYDVLPKSVLVNVFDSGFSSCNISLMQNDSFFWFNNRSVSSEIKSLNGGWSNIVLSPLSFQNISYGVVGQWIFYVDGLQACYLNVLPYNNVVSAHDSSKDVPVSFSLVTTVNPSNLVLNLLQTNFSSFNNQTQIGVLEVKNNGLFPLYNVKLNDSKGWIKFSLQDFTMDAMSNHLITFNITPIITSTSQSNKTNIISITGFSSNGGIVSRDISLFIPFTNLDNSSFGNNFIINRLSINATINFCKLHQDDVECIMLVDAFKSNVTVIREVPAQLTVTEDYAKLMWASMLNAQSLVQNNINSQGITQDYMNNISGKYDSSVEYAKRTDKLVSDWMNFSNMQLEKTNQQIRLFWIVFCSMIGLCIILFFVYNNWRFVWSKKTLQYNL